MKYIFEMEKRRLFELKYDVGWEVCVVEIVSGLFGSCMTTTKKYMNFIEELGEWYDW